MRGQRRYEADTCERKKRYHSEGEAMRAVRTMQKWKKGHCEALKAYVCRNCGRWHVGRDAERRR